jgi:cell shape-determining protein MreC
MSSPRFNQVYATLLGGAFLCAFVLPSRFTDPARLHLAGLFNPLSSPVRHIAAAIDRPSQHLAVEDNRGDDDLAQENDQLRQEIARLQADVDRLQRLESERQELGDLKAQCVRVAVAGNDSGGRDALLLAASTVGSLDQDAPVLYSGGLAGRLDARLGGARVRLLTDDGLAVTGAFIRFVDSGGTVVATRVAAPTPLVRGLGHGELAIVGMKWTDASLAGLRAGDWVVLNDPDWPQAVQGTRLGRIVSCVQSRQSQLFADIRLQPEADLSRLADVWVLQATRAEE